MFQKSKFLVKVIWEQNISASSGFPRKCHFLVSLKERAGCLLSCSSVATVRVHWLPSKVWIRTSYILGYKSWWTHRYFAGLWIIKGWDLWSKEWRGTSVIWIKEHKHNWASLVMKWAKKYIYIYIYIYKLKAKDMQGRCQKGHLLE